MTKTKVPVHYYGIYPHSKREPAKDAARTTLFPHAKDSATFDRQGSKPDAAIIYVCFECREARHKWELEDDGKN